jgi:hypothetical protein
MSLKFSIFFILCFQLAHAQPPDTELWLFRITEEGGKDPQITGGKNITARPGYDNQPSFDAEGKKIFYSSIREDKQADVYVFDIKKSATTRVTASEESEYSPTPINKGKQLACVMVEKDSSQKIHFVNARNGNDEGRLEFDSVGYYRFLNADTVLYYKLTDPHSLRYHVISTGEDKFICHHPARTFIRLNRNNFFYAVKDSAKVTIYKEDLASGKNNIYAEGLPASEDLFYIEGWGLMRSTGATITRWNEQEQKWQLLFDLSDSGIKKITRFAIDSKKKYLVVVDNP